MTDLENFDIVWNGHFKTTKRGLEHKTRYENILFSIWKHHQEWDDVKGFQIKCNYKDNNYRAIYRVRELAEKAGLLTCTSKYLVGDHTNYYKKNDVLFDAMFRDSNNLYGKWLNESSNNFDIDIVGKLLKDEFNNLANNNYGLSSNNSPNVSTKPRKRRTKKLNYDLEKLYILSQKIFPRYYDFLKILNNSVANHELEYKGFIYFDKEGVPKGRPYSYFCSTLNPNKKHKIVTGELRPDFLKRIGLPNYYEVYDIKSEIPRINYLFHTGIWKDDDFDFYTEIINDYHKRVPAIDNQKVARGKAGAENYDDSMKQLFMRVYFGKGSEKQSFNGYKDDYMKRNKESWEYVKKYFPKEKMEDFIGFTFDEWYEVCCSVENICGVSIGVLVFWYAFFIETEVKIELLNRGKKVYNVYDGFYFDQDISAEIKALLKEKAEFVYENYMLPVKI